MKKDKFMEAMSEIDDELILRAEASRKKKSGLVKKIVLIAAIVTLISVLAVSIVIGNSVSSGGAESDSESKDSESVNTDQPIIDSAYWQDTREKNGKTAVSGERGIVWPWNCRAVYNQYTSVKVNGAEYVVNNSYWGNPMKATQIGSKIGDFTCEGFDEYENKKHTITCSVYEIKGVDSDRFVAVKYEGYEQFYPFKYRADSVADAPETLGELIDVLDLTNNIKLNKFYIEDEYSACYTLSDEKSAELWNIIKEYASVETEFDYSKPYEKAISFAINSSVLGVNNLSFSFYEEGYIFTNIESFGYYYNIGAGAVEKIADFVKENKQGVWVDETQYLVGTVTEIGEDYIKVDDSVVMKNSEEGIEFTVYANHMNIKRYIISGYLKVGDTVSVKHGYLPKENYTQIKNAIDLSECIISSSGQVLIPE